MNNLPWEAQLALAAIIGLIVGLLVMWLMMRQNGSKKKEHEELVKSFQHYRQDVDKHFVDTAAAVDELNRSYQKVMQHLSSGAHSLMGKEALQEQLALRSNKTVTLSYLADTTAPAGPIPAAVPDIEQTPVAVTPPTPAEAATATNEPTKPLPTAGQPIDAVAEDFNSLDNDTTPTPKI